MATTVLLSDRNDPRSEVTREQNVATERRRVVSR
jgi:hypothetical protein